MYLEAFDDPNTLNVTVKCLLIVTTASKHVNANVTLMRFPVYRNIVVYYIANELVKADSETK